VKKCFDNNLYDVSLKDAHSHRDEIVVCAKYWDVNEMIALGAIFTYFHVKFIYWDKDEKETEFPYKVPYWLPALDYYRRVIAKELSLFANN